MDLIELDGVVATAEDGMLPWSERMKICEELISKDLRSGFQRIGALGILSCSTELKWWTTLPLSRPEDFAFPFIALAFANDVLTRRVVSDEFISKRLDELHFECSKLTDMLLVEGRTGEVFLPDACLAAIRECWRNSKTDWDLWDDVLTGVIAERDVEPDSWDSAYFACLSYSGGFSDDMTILRGSGSADRIGERRKFWRSWVRGPVNTALLSDLSDLKMQVTRCIKR